MTTRTEHPSEDYVTANGEKALVDSASQQAETITAGGATQRAEEWLVPRN